MQLSEKERRIYRTAMLTANASVETLRKRSGYRDHTVRYCLQRAKERGLLTARPFLDLGLLGITQFEIFFSISSEKQESREKLLRALLESDRVSWLGELGGDFQYGVNICATGVRDLYDFLDALSARYGHIFLEKQVAVRVSLSFFGNKYLDPKAKTSRKELSYTATDERTQIDQLDHRILRGLMEYGLVPRRRLAQLLKVPLSTVEYRIRRLEQSGLIVGYYYLFNSADLGIQSFLFLVGVKSIHAELRKQFYDFCAQHPNVILYVHTIGSWDFEIAVEVEDSRQIMRITQELHDALGTQLRFIKVLPSFSYPKVMEYPFRDAVPGRPF